MHCSPEFDAHVTNSNLEYQKTVAVIAEWPFSQKCHQRLQ